MGYTTEFKGQLKFNNPLTADQVKYIQAFNQTRRMKRNAEIAATLPDPLREAVNLPIGEDGAYYVGSAIDGNHGQTKDKSVVEYNDAPGTFKYEFNNFHDGYKANEERIYKGLCQPGLWCNWTVSDDGTILEWDGGEKFYYYIEWLKYLIDKFFSKWDAVLNGKIKWRGEDFDDEGTIIVENNIVPIE